MLHQERVGGFRLALRYLISLFLFFAFTSAIAGPQKVVWLVDIDHTIVYGANGTWVFLDQNPEINIPRPANLPEKVWIPTNLIDPDYEGSFLRNRLGRIEEGGAFTPGPGKDLSVIKLPKVRLPNGKIIEQEFIPAYYYIDPQLSYQDYSSEIGAKQKDMPFLQWLKRAHSDGVKYLQDSFALMAVGFKPAYSRMTTIASASDRRHWNQEIVNAFKFLADAYGLTDGSRKVPVIDPALQFMINGPDGARFNGDKMDAIKKVSAQLKRVRVSDMDKDYHVLIYPEDKRKYILAAEKTFNEIHNSFTHAKVVHIIIRAAEPEVMKDPYKRGWAGEHLNEEWSRVSIYWPNQVLPEKTNNLSRVLEVAYGLTPEVAEEELNHAIRKIGGAFKCTGLVKDISNSRMAGGQG